MNKTDATSNIPEWAMLEAASMDLPYTLGANPPCNLAVARALAAAYARGRQDALSCYACRGSGRVTIFDNTPTGFHDEPCPDCARAIRAGGA